MSLRRRLARRPDNLGTALAGLGRQDTERLVEAVVAFHAALEERTRERVPFEWAATQSNLGTALRTIGERENRIEQLKEAVAAYRLALQEVRTQTRTHDWARTQNKLGIALQRVAALESEMEWLEDAATAFRAALEEFTREKEPLEWAMTQNNLAEALLTLSLNENGTERLEQSVASYRASIQEYTFERSPLKWARVENRLGIALHLLGDLVDGTVRLKQAVVAFKAALRVYQRETVPLEWANTQHALGSALEACWGGAEDGTAQMGRGRECLSGSLGRIPDRFNGLGLDTDRSWDRASTAGWARRRRDRRLEEAVGAYRAALKIFKLNKASGDWIFTQVRLANALQDIGDREGGIETRRGNCCVRSCIII